MKLVVYTSLPLERLRQKLFQKPPATNHGSSSLIEPVSLTNDSQGRNKEFKILQVKEIIRMIKKKVDCTVSFTKVNAHNRT